MKRFIRNDSGATAIEYVLIAMAMGLALITVMPGLATATFSRFSSLGSHITAGK